MSCRFRVFFVMLRRPPRSTRTDTLFPYTTLFRSRPIEPLQMLDTHGRVIYVGSFSKTMLPTLRLGFLVAPPSLRAALEAAKFLADWHSPLATQADRKSTRLNSSH